MCLPEPAAKGSLEEGASQQEPPLCCSHCPELLCPLTPVTAVPGLLSALPAQPCWRAPAWGAAKVRPWVRLPCSRLSFRPRSDLRGFSGRKVSNAQPGGGFWLLSQWPASWCFLKGSGTWLAPWHVCYRGPGCVPAVSAGRRDCGAGLLCAGRSQPSDGHGHGHGHGHGPRWERTKPLSTVTAARGRELTLEGVGPVSLLEVTFTLRPRDH